MTRAANIIVFLIALTIASAGFFLLLLQNQAPHAGLTDAQKKVYAHYESAFKNLKIEQDNGEILQLSKIESPIVMLNFWASWCTPCLVEFPSLVKLNEKFEDKQLKIIGINTDTGDQIRKMNRIISEYQLNFLNIPDKNGELTNTFIVRAIPVTIIFNRGKVVEVSTGEKDFMAVEFLNQLRSWIDG